MAYLNEWDRFIVARNYKRDRGQGLESLRNIGRGFGRKKKEYSNGLINVLRKFHDKYGDSGVNCFIIDISNEKENFPECETDELLMQIIDKNGFNASEYRPHYDYDCTGIMMRDAPSIRKIGKDKNRYMVVSRWFIDC